MNIPNCIPKRKTETVAKDLNDHNGLLISV